MERCYQGKRLIDGWERLPDILRRNAEILCWTSEVKRFQYYIKIGTRVNDRAQQRDMSRHGFEPRSNSEVVTPGISPVIDFRPKGLTIRVRFMTEMVRPHQYPPPGTPLRGTRTTSPPHSGPRLTRRYIHSRSRMVKSH